LRTALTIAGSDSGGGAGIQADLRTFHAFGVFGMTAVTAVTAQNTHGVHAVHVVPPEIVRSQILAVAGDLDPAATKSGMLATRELVGVVAQCIEDTGLPDYVLDPVMVATSGDRLLDEDAERSIVEWLLPLCTLVTPNLDEAAILTGESIDGVAGMEAAARRLVELGAAAALVKGGHMEGEEVVDVLFDGTRVRSWRQPKLATLDTHGTGCTLSAAVTAGLALGRSLMGAVDDAIDYVHRAIAAAPGLGGGRGPLDHFIAPRARPHH